MEACVSWRAKDNAVCSREPVGAFNAGVSFARASMSWKCYVKGAEKAKRIAPSPSATLLPRAWLKRRLRRGACASRLRERALALALHGSRSAREGRRSRDMRSAQRADDENPQCERSSTGVQL